jgi:hypothetical protein
MTRHRTANVAPQLTPVADQPTTIKMICVRTVVGLFAAIFTMFKEAGSAQVQQVLKQWCQSGGPRRQIVRPAAK